MNRDYRTREHLEAFQDVIARQPPDVICLSIGGGPTREHTNLVTLNIGPFPNVDVVADAYELPYADESVGAVYCEAVLEHLEYPDRAVAEMWRILRKGGEVFAATPFLQWYHAYPNHFQNFTLTGHERLFARAGFTIVCSGTSVGPTVAMSNLMHSYVISYLPIGPLRRAAGWVLALATLPIKPLDLVINRNPDSHRVASATFIRAAKRIP